jgi:Transcription initiation factor TFIIIB, Brf1 subunit/Transcription initiation factor TFIIB
MASDYFSKMSYLPREVVEAGRVLAEHFTARRGRSLTPALAYACVYAASKISGVPIRLTRLEAMSGVRKRAIVRAHRELVDALGLVEPPVNPKAYVKHYCEIFHLPPEVEARACALVDLDGPNLPPAIAAGAVYYAAEEAGERINRKALLREAEISHPTLIKWVKYFRQATAKGGEAAATQTTGQGGTTH